MSYSRVLEELKIKLSPYIRAAIIGKQNRLGHGAPLEEKLSDNQYKINGETITLNDINEKDFYEIAAFVSKIIKQEIGGANKTNETLDSLIAEVLHVLKFNSISLEHNLKNIIEADILNDPDFKLASDAFFRLNEKENISKLLKSSDNSATQEIAKKGEYGELKNRCNSAAHKLDSNELFSQDISEFNQNISKTEEIQGTIKNEAATYLKENMQLRNNIAARCKELRNITKNNEKGSAEYENAIAELRQITEQNRELFDNESKYAKAVEELSSLRKLKEKVMQKSATEREM